MTQTSTHSATRTTRSTDTGSTGAPHSRAQVQAFLDRMAQALTLGDGPALASMWEVPALVLGDEDDGRAVTSSAQVEQFFSGAKERYNQRGITDTRADIQHLSWPTDRTAIVEVRWPYLDAQGHEVGDETSTYTLRRDARGELKLRVTLMHGAKTFGQPKRAAS